MSRIKLTLPEHFFFSTSIKIRITDLNYGNHLGNDVVLSLVHEARVQFLAAHQYTEMDLGGTSIIMGDVGIVYKSEGFYADEVTIHVGAADFTRAGFALYYKLMNETTGNELAQAKTGIVCFDYKQRKVTAVPAEVKERLTRH